MTVHWDVGWVKGMARAVVEIAVDDFKGLSINA
jgi:hypothetical protein